MAAIKVEVTQEDIDAGCRKSCYLCPVARALNRATSKEGWRADLNTCSPPQSAKRIKTPAKASKFMRDFDDDKPVKPFSFRMEIPR